MADSVKPTAGTNPPTPKKDLSMEMRLLIAFLLMGLVLFLTPYFYKPPATNRTQPPAAKVQKKAPQEEPRLNLPPVPGQIAGEKEETFVLDSNLYRVLLSNRGAVVLSWTLKKYTDSAGKPLELVN